MSQNYKDLMPFSLHQFEWIKPVYEGDIFIIEVNGQEYARYEYSDGMPLKFTVNFPELHQGELIKHKHLDDFDNLIVSGSVKAPHIPAPKLYEQEINFEGNEITGKADFNPILGDKVVVFTDQGEVLGEAEVQSDGSFKVQLAKALNPQDGYNIELSNKFAGATHKQVVPNTVEANDDYAQVEVNIKPVTTKSTGYVYGKPLLVDILGLKQHIFGKQPVLNFKVEEGHTLDANFKAWAGSKLALFDHVKLNLQFKNEYGQWETVTKSGSHGLFSTIWFFGQRAEIQVKDLPPGEYRVVASSNSLVSLLPAIKLEAQYTDYDHSKIGGVDLGVVNGNVFDGDLLIDAELTSVVSVDGKTVGANGLTLHGEHGILQIKADGTYSYVSNGKISSLGKTDSFEYTITDGRTTSTAKLDIQTVAPALGTVVANDEAVKAEVEFGHVVDAAELVNCTTFNTQGGGLFKKPSGSTSIKYVVDENTASDLVISASLPKWDSGTDFVIRVMQGNRVVAIEKGSTSNLTHIHGNKLTLKVLGLAEGEYRIEVESSRKTWSSNYKVQVEVVETVTHLDKYEPLNITASETANILDNDVTGKVVKWEVFDGTQFVEVAHSKTITGQYGELTINSKGDYVYKPFNDLPHSTQDLVDDFSYRLHGGNGEVSEAVIKGVVEVSGAGVPAFKLSAFNAVDELESFNLGDDVIDLTSAKVAANDEFDALESVVSLNMDDVLSFEQVEEVQLPASAASVDAESFVVESTELNEVYDVQLVNNMLNDLLDEQTHFAV